MEPQPPAIATSRLADPGRGPAVVALLAAVFVAAATGSSLLAGASGPATHSNGSALQTEPRLSPAAVQAGAATGATPGQPSPTVEPSLRPGEIACMPAGWRLAYEGSVGSWRVETWLVVEPAAASDPLDARIPVTQLGHDVVAGLGACAPPTDHGGGRPAAIERAWRISRAGGSEVAVPIGLVPLTDGTTAPGPRRDALALVRPAGPGASWATGEYVLEIAPPETAGMARSADPPAWLRIRLESPTP